MSELRATLFLRVRQGRRHVFFPCVGLCLAVCAMRGNGVKIVGWIAMCCVLHELLLMLLG